PALAWDGISPAPTADLTRHGSLAPSLPGACRCCHRPRAMSKGFATMRFILGSEGLKSTNPMTSQDVLVAAAESHFAQLAKCPIPARWLYCGEPSLTLRFDPVPPDGNP